MRQYYQGVYNVVNVHKYIGDPTKCIYRSSWEKKVFKKLDFSDYVLKWGAEPFAIPYLSPKDGHWHRYFPDIIVKAKGKDGAIVTIIEVKPYKEQFPPKKQGKKKSRFLMEQMTYEVNQAKWDAAKAMCEKKGWRFEVMTENEINPVSMNLKYKNKKR